MDASTAGEENTTPRTPHPDEDKQPTAAWWRGAIIGAIALTLAIGTLIMVWLLAQPLTLLLIGVVLAQAMAPIVSLGARWMPRVPAVLLAYVVVILVFVGLGWLLSPVIVDEAQTLAENAPNFVEEVETWFDELDQDIADQILGAVGGAIEAFADVLVEVPMTVVESVFNIFFIFITSVFWLIVMPEMKGFLLSLFPLTQRQRAEDVLGSMGQTLGGYVRGSVIGGLIMAVAVYVGLSIIGLEYVLVFAVLAFIGEFFPVIGPNLAAIPAVGVALLDSFQLALIVVAFYLVLNQIEGNVLAPVIMKNQARISPLLTVFATVSGFGLGGLVGAIIAIPLLGALQVLVTQVAAPAIRNWSGSARDEELQKAQERQDASNRQVVMAEDA